MKSGQLSRFIVVLKFKLTRHPEGSSIASGTHRFDEGFKDSTHVNWAIIDSRRL